MDGLDGTQVEHSKAKTKTPAPSARKQARNGSEVDGPKSQRPIDQWPDATSSGIQGRSSDKVPTEIQYAADGSFKWGFEISEGERSKWFNLLLDPDSSSNIDIGQAKYYADPQAAPPGYNQEPEDIVKDYLSALRRHIQAVLYQMLPQSVALSTPVKYVLTVPAMWSDIAIDRTRRCAELAGMGASTSLNIVSEPEAAAIWALQEVPPGSIEIGDSFIVCDAGGGTVDLISYKVTGLKPILRVTMVVPGKGKKCGSSFLNRRFEEFLKAKLGGHPSWHEDMLEEASNRFDGVTKRCYNGSKTSHYQIPVPTFPDSPTYNVRRARYTLKGADLYDIFEPVIQDVLAVLLVGGFGENRYLYKRIQQAIAPEGIEVLKSPYGWTAVVRGALIKGLADHNPKNTEVNVAGRYTSFHYETESAKVWDKKVHEEDKRFWSAANSRWEVNTYDWFVLKAEAVSEKKPIRLPYHSECLANKRKLDPITITIVKCADVDETRPPLFVRAEGEVTPVAHLEVPLSLFPTKNLKKRQSEDGQEWFIVDFTLKVTRTSSEFRYDLMRGNKSYGRVPAEFV
ncbi:MAG: hypothetical protein Q9204_000057 [Flavoplaca sp. TL-2023a]